MSSGSTANPREPACGTKEQPTVPFTSAFVLNDCGHGLLFLTEKQRRQNLLGVRAELLQMAVYYNSAIGYDGKPEAVVAARAKAKRVSALIASRVEHMNTPDHAEMCIRQYVQDVNTVFGNEQGGPSTTTTTQPPTPAAAQNPAPAPTPATAPTPTQPPTPAPASRSTQPPTPAPASTPTQPPFGVEGVVAVLHSAAPGARTVAAVTGCGLPLFEHVLDRLIVLFKAIHSPAARQEACLWGILAWCGLLDRAPQLGTEGCFPQAVSHAAVGTTRRTACLAYELAAMVDLQAARERVGDAWYDPGFMDGFTPIVTSLLQLDRARFARSVKNVLTGAYDSAKCHQWGKAVPGEYQRQGNRVACKDCTDADGSRTCPEVSVIDASGNRMNGQMVPLYLSALMMWRRLEDDRGRRWTLAEYPELDRMMYRIARDLAQFCPDKDDYWRGVYTDGVIKAFRRQHDYTARMDRQRPATKMALWHYPLQALQFRNVIRVEVEVMTLTTALKDPMTAYGTQMAVSVSRDAGTGFCHVTVCRDDRTPFAQIERPTTTPSEIFAFLYSSWRLCGQDQTICEGLVESIENKSPMWKKWDVRDFAERMHGGPWDKTILTLSRVSAVLHKGMLASTTVMERRFVAEVGYMLSVVVPFMLSRERRDLPFQRKAQQLLTVCGLCCAVDGAREGVLPKHVAACVLGVLAEMPWLEPTMTRWSRNFVRRAYLNVTRDLGKADGQCEIETITRNSLFDPLMVATYTECMPQTVLKAWLRHKRFVYVAVVEMCEFVHDLVDDIAAADAALKSASFDMHNLQHNFSDDIAAAEILSELFDGLGTVDDPPTPPRAELVSATPARYVDRARASLLRACGLWVLVTQEMREAYGSQNWPSDTTTTFSTVEVAVADGILHCSNTEHRSVTQVSYAAGAEPPASAGPPAECYASEDDEDTPVATAACATAACATFNLLLRVTRDVPESQADRRARKERDADRARRETGAEEAARQLLQELDDEASRERAKLASRAAKRDALRGVVAGKAAEKRRARQASEQEERARQEADIEASRAEAARVEAQRLRAARQTFRQDRAILEAARAAAEAELSQRAQERAAQAQLQAEAAAEERAAREKAQEEKRQKRLEAAAAQAAANEAAAAREAAQAAANEAAAAREAAQAAAKEAAAQAQAAAEEAAAQAQAAAREAAEAAETAARLAAAAEAAALRASQAARALLQECLICMNRGVTQCVLPCLHAAYCDDCAKRQEHAVRCPMCNGTRDGGPHCVPFGRYLGQGLILSSGEYL